MLTATEVRRNRRRRSPPSLMQQYQEYVMQRIESFKNSLHRDELLRLGDEAVSELQATCEGQFILTEVLMLESVDRLIMKRLKLRPYVRWSQQFLKLRAAQRQPTHWGLDSSCPVASLLPRIEPEDVTLVVGAGVEGCACLLAAHDVAVNYIAGDVPSVERVEARMAGEALGSMFSAWVVQLGHWLPDFDRLLSLVVIDVGSLADLDAVLRCETVRALQERTVPGGVHVLAVGDGRLAPEALRSLYAGWTTEPVAISKRNGRRRRGIALMKPISEETEVA